MLAFRTRSSHQKITNFLLLPIFHLGFMATTSSHWGGEDGEADSHQQFC